MAVVQVGLISDTHMPKRWKALHPEIFEVLAGVDVILHAGDVGELWVLDQLSAIAPVVAVHGNDETDEATAALPYLQTFSFAGQRAVLTHGHYPDRAEELASRMEDMRPMLQRRADMAKMHGATIIIFGHTHIPMNLVYDDVLLVNPGALASGNPWTRQTVQSVARMTLSSDEKPLVEHFDLASPQEILTPFFDLEAGFSGLASHFSGLIVDESFLKQARWLWDEVFPLAREPLEETLHEVCHEVWAGEREMLQPAEFVKRLRVRDDIPAEVYEKLRGSALFTPYL